MKGSQIWQDLGVNRRVRNRFLLHSARVRRMAMRVAEVLSTDSTCLAHAALMHDIGKVAIAPEILLKPGRLTPMEYKIVQTHVLAGEWLCRGDRDVAALVRHHHERWDGGGYPDKLMGEEIPLGSRILTVCDVYDTICRDARPYAEQRTHADAIAELHLHAGTQFDPGVVSVFADLFAEAWSRGSGDPIADPVTRCLDA